MSRLAAVLHAAREGQAPADIAADLGISRGVVDVMLSNAERLGRLEIVTLSSCGQGTGCAPETQTACATCPIRPR